ncbi:DUF2243 domain-containing protein [Micromonospora halotolerans]|uniref:DUF2243 domain-containing protein n=1 Tax=Micromonospora halotolerans TaxID=709879 RepID=A0ABY9ZX37_9ACTN|nr:DUF2243 domain-containing protein [Micromonospora halotolerans]WNM39849.1 DUF2243 domain-containing protein [Micromonospora halotolerans]
MTRPTIDGADIRGPATILGVGLGGFVDGILLHQVLQWHHLLSSTDTDRIGVRYYPVDTVAGLKMNTLWDGLFHTVTWVAVLTGLALLYARVTRSRGRLWRSPALWGWALVGWGLFNLVEGLVDHQILGIHHVRGGPHQLWWDLGFLTLGAIFVVIGWAVQRRASAVDLCAAEGR